MLAGILLLGGCRCVTFTKKSSSGKKSKHGVPLTLKAFRALHDPPKVIAKVTHVKIEKKKRRVGLPNCGHAGPACLVMLPLMLLPSRPKEYDQAVLIKGDVETVQAKYSNERLVSARVRKGSAIHYLGRLRLVRLGQNKLVELGRSTLDDDGEEGPVKRSPVEPQLDLYAVYKKAQTVCEAKEGHFRESCRRGVAAEAVRVLQEELPDFARRLAGSPASTSALAALIEQVCAHVRGKERLARNTAVIKALGKKPPLEVAVAATRCFSPSRGIRDGALAATVARPIIKALCRGEEKRRHTSERMLWLRPAGERVRPQVEACEDEKVQKGLRQLLGVKAR